MTQFRRLVCERLESRQLLTYLPLVCGGLGHSESDRQEIFNAQAESARQTFVGEQAEQTLRWSQRLSQERGEGESRGQQRGGSSDWEAPPIPASPDYGDYRVEFTAIRVSALLIDAGSSLLILTEFPPSSLFANGVTPTVPAIPDAVAIDASLDAPSSPSPSPVTIPAPLLDAEIPETPRHGESVSIDRDASRLVAALPHSALTLTPPATRLVASTLPAFDDAVSFIQPLRFASTDAVFRLGWLAEDDLMSEPAELLSAPGSKTRHVALNEDSKVVTGHWSLVTGHGEARPASSDEDVDAWFARSNDPLDRDSESMIELAVSRAFDAQDFKTPDFKAIGEGGHIDATHGVEYLRAEEGRAVYQVMDIAVVVEETVEWDLMTTAEPAAQTDTDAAPVEAAAVQEAPVEAASLEATSLEAAPPDDPTSPLTKAILLPGFLAALLGRRRRSSPQIVA